MTRVAARKPAFLSPLRVEKIGRKNWRYLAPLVYYCEILGCEIVCEVGEETDFGSVPRFPPLAYALFGNTAHEEAGIHDKLCREGKVPRRVADAVFKEAFAADRWWLATKGEELEPWWRRAAMWVGVRLGARVGIGVPDDDEDETMKGESQ